MGENKPPKRSNIKKIIHARKMQQKDLAKLADLETYQVSEIVNVTRYDMLLSTAVKICEALKISFDEGFGDRFLEMKSDIVAGRLEEADNEEEE